MRSKPLGFDYLTPKVQRRLKDDAEFAAMDRQARIEYNQTELIELHRLARSDRATVARAHQDMLEGSLHEIGETVSGGLSYLTSALEGINATLASGLERLSKSSEETVVVLRNIEDMLFHIATGRDYNATLQRRADADAEERRQRGIAADYAVALDYLKQSVSEPNQSRRKMQMEDAEVCLGKALTVPGIEAQAAMELGTLLLARDGNLKGAAYYYERSLGKLTRWSAGWVYVSGLLANVEARNDDIEKAHHRMQEIIHYSDSLGRWSDEIEAINRDEDCEAQHRRLVALIGELNRIGGDAGRGLDRAGYEAERGMRLRAIDLLKREEKQLLQMFSQAKPNPVVFYECARYAMALGKEDEATELLEIRSRLFGDDLDAQRAFLLQIQSTPEFSNVLTS